MKLIYVSGRYSAPTRQEQTANVADAAYFAKKILLANFIPVTPHAITCNFDHDPLFLKWTHDDWMEKFAYPLLARCDAIFLCWGWQVSKGVRLELEYAQSKGIPVAHCIDDLQRIFG